LQEIVVDQDEDLADVACISNFPGIQLEAKILIINNSMKRKDKIIYEMSQIQIRTIRS
jgi:hypothetical protein